MNRVTVHAATRRSGEKNHKESCNQWPALSRIDKKQGETVDQLALLQQIGVR
jgi:hypothetical protein